MTASTPSVKSASDSKPSSIDASKNPSSDSTLEKSEDAHDVPASLPEIEAEKEEAPDGGLRAWLRVLGAFLILANTMGLQSSFGAFQYFYSVDLLSTYPMSTITWIGTIQIFCSASGGIISGPMFDLGYDKIMMFCGCFCAVFGYMMTSLSTQYYQIFLAQGIVGGLAGAFCFAPCLALAAVSFRKLRSFAIGIAMSGFAFGAVIYPIVFRRLQPMVGFSWATRIMAFIALGCFLVAYPLVYWKTPSGRGERRKIWDWRAWKEPAYAIYCWAVFFMYAGYWPPYFFIATFSTDASGTSVSLAFYIFAIANAANCVARWTATLIGDYFGVIEVLVASTAVSAIIAFCWPAVMSMGGLITWAVFWGYFSGISSALFASNVPSLSPALSVVGTRMGMLNGLFGIACLISPPIAGAIIATEGNRVHSVSGYLGKQMWVAVCLAISTALFIYPMIHLRRQRALKADEGQLFAP